MGYPASGKTTLCQQYIEKGYTRCNRDIKGGSLSGLLPAVEAALQKGESIILDNTYPTVESRKPLIDLAKKYGAPIHLEVLDTTIEDAQFNACLRAIKQYGKLLDVQEMRATKDPSMFPAAVLFSYRKTLEPATPSEGFNSITQIPFTRVLPNYTNKGIIFDYDGTLRTTKSGAKYPVTKQDIEILPHRKEVLAAIPSEYIICGASNQSGVAKGVLSNETAKSLFDHTNELLGKEIDYTYCPHGPMPITCFCRKPMPGIGVAFMEKHKLDLRKTIMVGDLKSDKTFAARLGIQFVEAETFFSDPKKYLI